MRKCTVSILKEATDQQRRSALTAALEFVHKINLLEYRLLGRPPFLRPYQIVVGGTDCGLRKYFSGVHAESKYLLEAIDRAARGSVVIKKGTRDDDVKLSFQLHRHGAKKPLLWEMDVIFDAGGNPDCNGHGDSLSLLE